MRKKVIEIAPCVYQVGAADYPMPRIAWYIWWKILVPPA